MGFRERLSQIKDKITRGIKKILPGNREEERPLVIVSPQHSQCSSKCETTYREGRAILMIFEERT